MQNLTITVFGSGKVKEGSSEYREAYNLGKLIAEAGYILCNGGYGGIMEATAAGAKSRGGKTIGILVESFGTTSNKYIDEKIVTKSLLERLALLIELGRAYIILPGASGTLVELATVWEYMIKGLMNIRPIITIGNFWDNITNTINSRLIYEDNERFTRLVKKVNDAEECVKLLNQHFYSR
ncbi:MAG: hypothetical protein IGBAC_0339 [Ignavibacteriae bacterium]|nr:MAG: hypothetical protein IGBAC_0339 [Ignavibacteriota bacterium]